MSKGSTTKTPRVQNQEHETLTEDKSHTLELMIKCTQGPDLDITSSK